MSILSSFFVGILFAIGLGISGMTQPEKVMGFLDFTGNWDASLMFVMGGAVAFYFLFFKVLRGSRPVLAERFQLPTKRTLDRRLIIGAGLFGVGWALAGFCPGPALTSIGSGASSALVFVAAMSGGMLLFKVFDAAVARRRSQAATKAPDAKPVAIMLPTGEIPAQPYGVGLATVKSARRQATRA